VLADLNRHGALGRKLYLIYRPQGSPGKEEWAAVPHMVPE